MRRALHPHRVCGAGHPPPETLHIVDHAACFRAFFRAFLAVFLVFADDAASETAVLGASASLAGVEVVGVDLEFFEGRWSGDPSSPCPGHETCEMTMAHASSIMEFVY